MTDAQKGRKTPAPARRRRRQIAGRQLRFTREGKYFVALTFGIGFAAINTGNNLLYLVLGMLLALIVGSGILSELALRGLVASRQPPQRIFAETPFLMGITLTNTKRRLPSFSIEVEDELAGAPLEKKCYFLKVPARRTQKTAYRHTFAQRGRYQLGGYTFSTRFPFGLFEKSRRTDDAREVLVYPRVMPLRPNEASSRESGEETGGRLGRIGEYHALRDYRRGDDPRDIAWRNSAKLGRPLVREHEDPSGRRISIFLDNRAGEQESLDPARQEEAVSRAASLAAHYLGRGFFVSLASRSFAIGSGSGQPHLDRLLTALALVEFLEPGASEQPLPALPRDVLRVHATPATTTPLAGAL